MSTKLNADELAARRWPQAHIRRIGYADAIREVAQPIADERDELREALEDAMKIIGMHATESAAKWTSEPQKIADNADRALAPYRAILAKYAKP